MVALLLSVCLAWSGPSAQGRISAARGKLAQISTTDLKTWLTYISSDQLQGRQVFTEGYGLAAAYVADRLKEWGVKPLGEDGSYFQTVRLNGYRVTRHSSVTVEVNGQTRTFNDGDHVTFAANAGGPQTLTISGAEFLGTGIVLPDIAEDDYAGRDVRGKLAVWMGNGRSNFPQSAFRLLNARSQYTVETMEAEAAVGYAPPLTPAEQQLAQARAALAQATAAVTQAQQAMAQARTGRGGAGGGGRGGNQQPAPDFTTVQRVDRVVPPQFTGDDEFFAFLLTKSPTTFAELKMRAERREALPTFSLPDVTVTVHVDNSYDIVSTQLTRNVVGLVEGADVGLKNTYVLFGAHLDHLGYTSTPGAGRGAASAADPIFHGADDDGSGTTAELAIAKAFATGPRPKRSLVFVWHSGEEVGLYGSRYNADFPVVPLDQIQCELNIDMIGRNANNDPRNADQVYVVGDDRISTALHNVIVDVNSAQKRPLILDYAWNDPADPQRIYFRSDHYSYAAKGIPIAFFTTGLHPDYHQVSDTVDKIEFDKMTRIAQLVYKTGFSVADTDMVLVRDNRGPQSGKGSVGRIVRRPQP